MRKSLQFASLGAFVVAACLCSGTNVHANQYAQSKCVVGPGTFIFNVPNGNVYLTCPNPIPHYAISAVSNPAMAQIITDALDRQLQLCYSPNNPLGTWCNFTIWYDDNTA